TARRRRDIGVLLSFRSPPQEVNQHQRRFVGDDVSDGLSHTRRGNASRNQLLLRWGTLWGTFATCLFVPARCKRAPHPGPPQTKTMGRMLVNAPGGAL